MDIRLAEATDSDVDAFARFLLDAWEGYGQGAPGFAGATDAIVHDLARPEVLRRRIETPGRLILLAWNGNRLIGFASLRRLDAAAAELDGIIVHTDHTGAGVGSKLVAEVIDRAGEARLGRLVVHTEVTNPAARRFYERHGFEVTGTSVVDVGETSVNVWSLTRQLADHHE